MLLVLLILSGWVLVDILIYLRIGMSYGKWNPIKWERRLINKIMKIELLLIPQVIIAMILIYLLVIL
jgi:hypothetical protein